MKSNNNITDSRISTKDSTITLTTFDLTLTTLTLTYKGLKNSKKTSPDVYETMKNNHLFK